MSASRVSFRTFLQAGFECSTQRLRSGKRLDLLTSTHHDAFAYKDYCRLRSFGIRTIRTGARWHLIESSPGKYNFDSLAIILDAAEKAEMEVLLDLLHFGWPDHIDIFSSSFPVQFERFAGALARFVRARYRSYPFFAPVNEISFVSWAGGDVAYLNPFANGRGPELKRNLVRAAVRASGVLLKEIPGARLISPEPVIHITGNPDIPADREPAERYRLSQFEAWDMISGRMEPELGGQPRYLDIIGVNFYDRNEWIHNSITLTRGRPLYRPFHRILEEVWLRYRRPIFVAETGTEDEARPAWFNYICDEVFTAIEKGIPVQGICLYPILNHPGWDDDRHCHNGLLDYADESGNREVYRPLAHALLEQEKRFQEVLEKCA